MWFLSHLLLEVKLFNIVTTPINPVKLKEILSNQQAGSLVTFEGWVRDHNEGKPVSSLEYEVFEGLAIKEANKVIQEAKEKFDILDLIAVHRVGPLSLGEIAVWIGVSSKHRDAGFQACRYIIDEIKLRLPIWKKEHYVDGNTTWVNCQGCYKHAHIHYSEKEYYDKQLKLKNLGESGQALLAQSKVLVIGAGGLGCPALQYLAGAGIGHITICDGDHLEISNLHRQILYSHADIGEYKAILAKKRLNGLNPNIKVTALTDRIVLNNIEKLVGEHDLVLDCTDNFESKYLIHDACFFKKKPLVQASIYQSEGQLQTFKFDHEVGCMRCVWPDIPEQECVGSCVDVGVIGVVPGILGTMQATEAIKNLLQWESTTNSNTLLVDLMSWNISCIKRNRSKNCPLCGDLPNIKKLQPHNYGQQDYQLDLAQISDTELTKYMFIDIRQSSERDTSRPWENFLTHIPLSSSNEFELPPFDGPILLVCQKGIRSKNLAKDLRNSGANQVYSLDQGIFSVREHWDRMKR